VLHFSYLVHLGCFLNAFNWWFIAVKYPQLFWPKYMHKNALFLLRNCKKSPSVQTLLSPAAGGFISSIRRLRASPTDFQWPPAAGALPLNLHCEFLATHLRGGIEHLRGGIENFGVWMGGIGKNVEKHCSKRYLAAATIIVIQ